MNTITPSGSSISREENKLYYCLHNIGDLKHSNYTSLDKIMPLTHVCFDDAYYNVWQNWEKLKSKNVILFVIGDYVGLDNSWNLSKVPKLERHCGWYEIQKMYEDGATIGWHTKTHRNLTKLTDDEIVWECTPPFPMDYFAYPFGATNDRVIEIVKSLGFKKAYSVTRGGTCEFNILRKLLYNK